MAICRWFCVVSLFALGGCSRTIDSFDDELGDTGVSSTDSTGTSTSTSTSSTDSTGSTGSTDSTGSTEATDWDWNNCGVSVALSYVPPDVMFVVDASSSMVGATWDHDQDVGTPEVTRWSTLHGVLDAVLAEPANVMNAGVQRFPSADACPNAMPGVPCYDADACLVEAAPEVGVAPANAASILAAIPAADASDLEIVGGTPTTAAFVATRDHLLTQAPAVPKFVVLITDGAPNCGPDSPFPAALETHDDTLPIVVGDAWTNSMIATFVVGLAIEDVVVGVALDDAVPEANAFAALNEVALAGGVPSALGAEPAKFFAAQDEQDLLGAVESILDDVTDCVFDLNASRQGPPEAWQIPYVELANDGLYVPLVEDCESEAGWAWIVEGEILALCGSACVDAKTNGGFEAVYNCPIAE